MSVTDYVPTAVNILGQGNTSSVLTLSGSYVLNLVGNITVDYTPLPTSTPVLDTNYFGTFANRSVKIAASTLP